MTSNQPPTRIHPASGAYTDIHCHLLPDLDDGPRGWDESLRMARMAVADGLATIIATPHQLGAYGHNRGELIRQRHRQLCQLLNEQAVPLRVLPGADVRFDPELIDKLQSGDVLTLGDHGKHLLLELPHERYIALDELLEQLQSGGICVVLSHPERNQGLLRRREVLKSLVARGCLMQVTAASLLGGFGEESRRMAEWMLSEGLVHFVASDAHGARSRRPLLGAAFRRAAEIIGREAATWVCCDNPAAVASGRPEIRQFSPRSRRRPVMGWLPWRRAS